MELAPHIPIERCRLVKYDYKNKVMEQSFDEVSFIYPIVTIILLLNLVSTSNYWTNCRYGWNLLLIFRNS